MNPGLHDKMMSMVEKAGLDGISSNVPFKEEQFGELVKLRQFSILQAAYETQASEINLPVLAREGFTKAWLISLTVMPGLTSIARKNIHTSFFATTLLFMTVTIFILPKIRLTLKICCAPFP